MITSHKRELVIASNFDGVMKPDEHGSFLE